MTLAVALALAGPVSAAKMKVALLEPWDGRRVPAGQHCRMFGGDGATPPMQVWNIPEGTVWIVAEFNDRSFKPLSKDGGHGRIAWPAKWPVTYLYPVPGMTGLPKWGAFVVEPSKTIGAYASPGYLPPCSGGQKHKYAVDILAVDANGNVLDKKRNISIGKY
ncbi:MAG: hypothetical protein CML66_02055 [Rhodobacteraceae bacterium]|nr:hypothetical protein [Paracoccaceae bacterium]QEW19351.1 hypothetical protein LA6_001535 [Marinibacterium anthonyi]